VPSDEPGQLFLAASYLVLTLFGIVLGLFGIFLLAAGPRVGTTLVLPVGLLVAVVGHPVAAVLGLQLTGTRAGTVMPLLGWSIVVLPLSSGTSQGDVVLPGSLLSIAYLLVSVVTFALAVLRTRPTRGRTAFARH
jgi:hypothetical protein